ncbi:MAG: ABC transporter permease [Tannerellaceae bacterium]|nr:ABC transporter permease [Tannerellaceae bacterium]
MYKIYFKQAIQMLRQNLFMSIIAITGTALAIMMIMTIIVSEEIKNISVDPERHRARTYYLHHQLEKDTTKNHTITGDVTFPVYKEFLADMKTPEIICVTTPFKWRQEKILLNATNSDEFIPAIVRATDNNFWRMFSLSFIAGGPFTRETVESGVRDAVISESMAQKLFRGERALGQTFEIYELPYRMVGVVKDVSAIFSASSGDVWIPVTSDEIWQGGCTVIMVLKDKKEYPTLLEEIKTAEKKYLDSRGNWSISFNFPTTHREYMGKPYGQDAGGISKNIRIQYRQRIFILLLLLLIPAINLSGLSLSRIKKRMEEIGIRKAFGAKRHILLIQVLFENLITSVIGGIIGFLLSYIVIFNMRRWMLGIPAEEPIPFNTLISFPVISAICLTCILLNLISAGLPAWRAANFPIIHSITQNDKNV